MPLDELDRRVIGALQVDPRASWRRIAAVLDESPSTVTRRGMALLESGVVRIGAVTAYDATAIVSVQVPPAALLEVAAQIGTGNGPNMVAVVSPPTQILVEESLRHGESGGDLLRRYAALPDVTRVDVHPVLRYFRTTDEWYAAALLSPEEERVVHTELARERGQPRAPRDAREQQLVEVLREDGRTPLTQVADLLGVSESVARRRLADLVSSTVEIRTVLDARHIGLPESAWVSLRVEPARLAQVVDALREEHRLRFLAHVMGEHQLVAEFVAESLGALGELVTQAPWVSEVQAITTSLTLETFKRGGMHLR